MYLALRERRDTVMAAVDVKGAFLTVNQQQPTRVRCVNAAGIEVSYMLGKVLPGQRDGSLLVVAQRFGAVSWKHKAEDEGT